MPKGAISTEGAGRGQPDDERWATEYIEVPPGPAAEVYRVAVADAQDERATGIAALSTALAAADTHVVTRETLVESTLKLERPDDVPAADWSAGIDEAIAALEDA